MKSSASFGGRAFFLNVKRMLLFFYSAKDCGLGELTVFEDINLVRFFCDLLLVGYEDYA